MLSAFKLFPFPHSNAADMLDQYTILLNTCVLPNYFSLFIIYYKLFRLKIIWLLKRDFFGVYFIVVALDQPTT